MKVIWSVMVKKLLLMLVNLHRIKLCVDSPCFIDSLRIALLAFIMPCLTLTCSQVSYWIPPAYTPTLPPELAFLFDTPDPTFFAPTATLPLEELPEAVNTPIPPNNPEPIFATPTLAENEIPILYYAQAADTLPVVATRFGVEVEEIKSPDSLPPTSLLTPGQLLIIPRSPVNTTTSDHILPDSELVYSPSATDFDVIDYVNKAGGKLSTYKEWTKTVGLKSGAEIVQRVALENSINPRLLLALLEYQSQWVHGQPTTQNKIDYPMGYVNLNQKDLFRQLVWSVNQLSSGYYSWREGRLTDMQFKQDGYKTHLAPGLNAGSVALQYFFAQLYSTPRWVEAVDPEEGFPALYEQMFGNPWERALKVEPLYPPGLTQPPMILPFQMGKLWSFTGGPHAAWEKEGSFAALDFAPASGEPGCVDSSAWVVASASGLVVRSGNGIIVLDLDGDGFEQTGWSLLYLHISSESRLPVGTWVDVGTPLGHPSCEGGQSTGTHVHIARKFNGEWIAADGPMPFVLSGWTAHAGEEAYKGYLSRGEEKVNACTCSTRDTFIQRSEDDPY